MTMKKEDREYAARVIEGIISDKQSKGCANSCIECSKDSKGCARDPGEFEWKYKGILEKAIEFLRKPESVDDAFTEKEKHKRLLKAAVGALNDGSCIKDCRQCENYKSCDYDNRFEWQHTNEAMKLIGEGGDTSD